MHDGNFQTSFAHIFKPSYIGTSLVSLTSVEHLHPLRMHSSATQPFVSRDRQSPKKVFGGENNLQCEILDLEWAQMQHTTKTKYNNCPPIGKPASHYLYIYPCWLLLPFPGTSVHVFSCLASRKSLALCIFLIPLGFVSDKQDVICCLLY